MYSRCVYVCVGGCGGLEGASRVIIEVLVNKVRWDKKEIICFKLLINHHLGKMKENSCFVVYYAVD